MSCRELPVFCTCAWDKVGITESGWTNSWWWFERQRSHYHANYCKQLLCLNIIQLVYWSYLVLKFNETRTLYPTNLLRRTFKRSHRVPYSEWRVSYPRITFARFIVYVRESHRISKHWIEDLRVLSRFPRINGAPQLFLYRIQGLDYWQSALRGGHAQMQLRASEKILLELGQLWYVSSAGMRIDACLENPLYRYDHLFPILRRSI